MRRNGTPVGQFELSLLGAYNVRNALAAIAIGATVGLHTDTLADGLRRFKGVRRRMELRGTAAGVSVYDDFAHHPTAIEETLAGVRTAFPDRRIWAIFEPRSATSCRRIFQSDFARALAKADTVVLPAVFRSNLPEEERLSVEQLIDDLEAARVDARYIPKVDDIVETVARESRDGDLVVIMSNGGIRRHPRQAVDGPRRTHPPAVNSLSSDLVRVAAAGDSALVAEFPQRIDPDINQRALALAARLRGEWGEILRDVVIGYCTVTVYFNPRHVDARWLEGEIRVAARDVARDAENGERPAARSIDVPVCYDLELGPDLEDVAAFGACSVDEVIELHANRTYRVYMVGFVPGLRLSGRGRPAHRAAAADGAAHGGSRRLGGDRGRADRYLSEGHSRRLEHHRPHAAEAVRS